MYSQLSGQRIRYLFILALLTGLAIITLPLSADEKDLQKTLQRMEQLLQQQHAEEQQGQNKQDIAGRAVVPPADPRLPVVEDQQGGAGFAYKKNCQPLAGQLPAMAP